MPTPRKGDTVRQIVPAPIQGVVISKQFNEDSDAFQLLVEFQTPDGLPTEAWFDESAVEVIGD